MSWNFHESTRVGAETALDACDYFVDEVIEPWKVLGVSSKENFNFTSRLNEKCRYLFFHNFHFCF